MSKTYNKYDLSRPIDVYDREIFTGRVQCIDQLTSTLYEELFAERENQKRRELLWIVLRDLAVNYLQHPEQYLGVQLSPNAYSPGKRLHEIGLSYKPFKAVIDALKESYLDYGMGFKDRTTNVGKSTRIRASQKLIDIFHLIHINEHIDAIYPHRPQKSALIMKNAKKSVIRLPKDNPEIEDMIKQIETYNSHLHMADIDLTMHAFTLPQGDVVTIDLARKYVYRVFNNSNIACGGRLYGGWWMDCPSELRERIVINKHHTCEIDVKAIHPMLLYAEAGIDYMKKVKTDAYTLDNLEMILNRYIDDNEKKQFRNYFKSMAMVMINNENEIKAKRALQSEVNKWDGLNVRKGLPLRYPPSLDPGKKARLWAEFKAKHSPISHRLAGSGNREASYGRLMRIDSDFIMKTINKMLGHKITCLSVHDSIIVPWYAKELATEEIKNSFNECLMEKGISPTTLTLEAENFYREVKPFSKEIYIQDKDLLTRSYRFARTRRQSYLSYVGI